MATKVVGYIRVSTDKQVDSGISLLDQEKQIRLYCDLYGLELVQIYDDAGGSGRDLNRPGLAQAVSRLGVGGIDGLVIAKLDRLTRSVFDLGQLLNDYFRKYSLLSVGDQLDTGSANGRMVISMLMTVSQWERESISERTKSAMQHLKSQGKYTGGLPPYGKRLADGELVDDAWEQEVIREILKMRLGRLTYDEIVAELSRRGVRGRTGRMLSVTQVRRIVVNQ